MPNVKEADTMNYLANNVGVSSLRETSTWPFSILPVSGHQKVARRAGDLTVHPSNVLFTRGGLKGKAALGPFYLTGMGGRTGANGMRAAPERIFLHCQEEASP